jgi:hypothetical protein
MIKIDITFIFLLEYIIEKIKMLGRLAIPTRNIYEFVLCTIGVCIITKISFPPNEPPPNFPFIFGFNDRSEDANE